MGRIVRSGSRWGGAIVVVGLLMMVAPAGAAAAISQSQVSASFYTNPGGTGNFFMDWPKTAPLWTQTVPIINFNDDSSQDPPGFCPAPADSNGNTGSFARPFTDGVPLNPPTDTSCSYVTAENSSRTLQAGADTSASGGMDLTQFTAVMTGSYTVDGPQQVTFKGFSDDGFSLGIGPSGANQPTDVPGSGGNDMQGSNTAVNHYAIVGSQEGSFPPQGVSFTVNFPAAGTYPFELDYDEAMGGQLEMTLAVGNTVLEAPLTTSKTADSSTVATGGQDGYTITIGNPYPSAVSLMDITDTLPSGFSYVPGSTTSSGAAVADPRINGQTLTWSGPFQVPAGGSLSLHFNVRAPAAAGGPFYDNAGADASGGYVVTPTGNAAPVTVTASPSPTVFPPTAVTTPPPVESSSAALLQGTVNPNNAPTSDYFEYGLDSRYTRPGTSGPAYTNRTPLRFVGSGTSSEPVSASVSGLVPNALYHFRLVALNAAGTSLGPDLTFMTKKDPPPPAPVMSKSFDVSPARGLVLIEISGKLVPLTEARLLRSGTLVDARQGSLELMSAAPHTHKRQTGVFGGAIFRVTQAQTGLSTLSLVENAFKGAPTYASCTAHHAGDPAGQVALSRRILQTLRSRASGRFRTRGRYAAGTVRGTQWTTTDRCDGTLIAVQQHSVLVTDFVKHITVLVAAGHRYLARARR